jgi:hypothetical protein
MVGADADGKAFDLNVLDEARPVLVVEPQVDAAGAAPLLRLAARHAWNVTTS